MMLYQNTKTMIHSFDDANYFDIFTRGIIKWYINIMYVSDLCV